MTTHNTMPAAATVGFPSESPDTSTSVPASDVTNLNIPDYPAIRPGTTITWGTDGAAVIGARPGVRLYGDGEQLYPLVRAIASLDGSRAAATLIRDIPATLLSTLSDAGCLIPAPTPPGTHVQAQVVDACRSRVVDADADDAVAVALQRRQARVAVRGDSYLAATAMGLLRAAGVNIVETGADDSRATLALVFRQCDQDQLRPPAEASDPWLRLGLTHIVATVSGTRMLIGPITTPGVNACSRCIDIWLRTSLHQTPMAADEYQPVTQRPSRSLEAATICAGIAVGRALLAIDGLADSHTAETTMMDAAGRVEQLRIPVATGCGCHSLGGDTPVAG